MPVMPAWVDYLPDGGQARVVQDEAMAKARADVARLDTADVTTIALALADAAAESARLAVLAPSGSLLHLHRPLFMRVLPNLAALGPDAAFGVLAFANQILASGGHIDGHYDYTTRAGLDREVEVVERFAREGPRTRALAFVALGAGRIDLARALSDDAALRRLADACDAKRAEPFYELVSAFPESDLGYAELTFVARAFVVVLEERGRGGIGAATTWLYRAVREGPKPLEPYRPAPFPPDGHPPRPPPDGPPPIYRPPPPGSGPPPVVVYVSPPVVRKVPDPPQVNTGSSSRSWLSITLRDTFQKEGARAIAVSSIGDVEVVDLERGRFRTQLAAERVDEIDRILSANDPRAIRTPQRPGTIDDASQTLTLLDAEGKAIAVHRWTRDRHAAFDAIAAWLVALAAQIIPPR